MVTHMVMFKFNRCEDAEEARRQLLSMSGKIPGMTGIEVGLDFARGDRSYDLGLITRHDSRTALDQYRFHPVHLEVATFIRERSTGAAAVDFES